MLLSFTAPVNIRFPTQSITNISFVVQWDAVINQSVNGYIVSVHWTDERYRKRSFTVQGTSYTVTELTPNTTYTVTVAAVEPNCNGLDSVGKEVTTTVSVSMDTISTIDTSSINPTVVTVTTDNSVSNNVINSTIDSVPTLTVTIMSTTTTMPTMKGTNPVSTTGKFIITHT